MTVAGGADQDIWAPEMLSWPGCQQSAEGSLCAEVGESVNPDGARAASRMTSVSAFRRIVVICRISSTDHEGWLEIHSLMGRNRARSRAAEASAAKCETAC